MERWAWPITPSKTEGRQQRHSASGDAKPSPRAGLQPDTGGVGGRRGELAASCWLLTPFCADSWGTKLCPAGGQGPPHRYQALQQQPLVRRGHPQPQLVCWLSAGRHRHLPGRSVLQVHPQQHRQPCGNRPNLPQRVLCLASQPATAGSPPLLGFTSPCPDAGPCPGPPLSQRPGSLPTKPI